VRTIASLVVLSVIALACGDRTASAPTPTRAATEPPVLTLVPAAAPSAATPTVPPPTATAPPTATPVPFRIQFDPVNPAHGEPFVAIVTGLQPGEPFELTVSPGRPMSRTADARGQFRLGLAGGVRDATCFTARRNDGSSTSASAGSATACADADAALSGPSPKVVGPTEFFTIRVNLPVGTQLTFIGLNGPDGRRIPDRFGAFGWQRAVTEQPVAQLHRFSPEYEGAGPLPAGDYTWSYEVLGRRYEFKVTLVR